MRSWLLILVALVPSAGSAQQPHWYLLSREQGCVELTTLVEAYSLPRAPTSPDDYAQMMRERGKKVTLGLPKEVPADFNGKIVQVRVGDDDGGPVFVTDEVCRKLGRH